MAIINCPNCGEEVLSNSTNCPYCGEKLSYKRASKKNDDIENTTNFFLKYSKTIKIICIIFSVVFLIMGILMMEDSDGISIVIGLISSFIVIGLGIFLEKSFKWKAYMLKNTYEINLKL